MTGSLMLKIAGITDMRPMVLYWALRAMKHMRITRPMVMPVPPAQIMESVA